MSGVQKTDVGPFRATFGQPYPDTIEFINSRWDRTEVSNAKVNFLTTKKTYNNIAFSSCQFRIGKRNHIDNNNNTIVVEQLYIDSLTFKECHFAHCFLGDIKFENVRFVDCTFESCDFGQSAFHECVFVDVVFNNCTGWFIRFARTTIDPRKLINGLCLPVRNYVGRGKELKDSRRKNIESLEAISDQLCDSLSNTTRPGYYDKALYYSKYYGFYHRLNNFLDYRRYGRLHEGLVRRAIAFVGDFIWLLWNGINLLLTRGGTSLVPLFFVLAIASLLVFPFQISPTINIEFQGKNSYLPDATYKDLVVVGLELFMAFGYTNFKALDEESHRKIAVFAISGVLWYAFLVPVLLRRVYK